MAASPKEKFDAAVKVIQSLPKNGSFQPSNELMLKFYAYYKQATLGPCTTAKPSFWDVVGKAKWDAWNKLGRMAPEDAMMNYVDELKQIMKLQFGWQLDKERIVEAMPHTTMVAEFVQTLGTFYELVDDKVPNGKPALHTNGGPVPAAIEQSALTDEDDASFSGGAMDSDLSSDNRSQTTSSESSPVRVASHISPVCEDNQVVVATIPTKAVCSSPPDELGDEQHLLYGQVNGHTESRPVNGEENGKRGESDSEAEEEEFCDTSDLPDEQIQYSQIQSGNAHILGATKPSGPPNKNVPAQERGGGNTDRSGSSHSPDFGFTQETTQQLPRGGESRRPRDLVPSLSGGGAGEGGGEREGGGAGGNWNRGSEMVTEQIALALVRLQQDMNSVLARLSTLEALSVAQHQMQQQRSRQSSESERSIRRNPWWWPFNELSPRTVIFFTTWPILLHFIFAMIRRRRRR